MIKSYERLKKQNKEKISVSKKHPQPQFAHLRMYNL